MQLFLQCHFSEFLMGINGTILGNNRSILKEILNRIIGRKNRIFGTALVLMCSRSTSLAPACGVCALRALSSLWSGLSSWSSNFKERGLNLVQILTNRKIIEYVASYNYSHNYTSCNIAVTFPWLWTFSMHSSLANLLAFNGQKKVSNTEFKVYTCTFV